jgi:hypothetical protein
MVNVLEKHPQIEKSALNQGFVSVLSHIINLNVGENL